MGSELKSKLEDVSKFFEINKKGAKGEFEVARIDGILRALKDATDTDIKNLERAHAYFSGLAEGYQKIAALLHEHIENKKQSPRG